MSAIITLTTDFGSASPYAAAMKGVILGINPQARIVDVSHEVGAQNLRHGAAVMAEATPWFPAGTVHVGVVDPGVGTSRRLVYARIGDQQYLAPDNGLLSLLAARARPARIIELANVDYWMPTVSHTFHGRDILAPVAAQLSLDLEPERLGPTLAELVMLDWPEPRSGENRIEGAVRWIDRFGNLITNISEALLAEASKSANLRFEAAGKQVRGLVRAYAERSAGELVALVGSSGYLELAVVDGSAAETLRLGSGAAIVVEW